MNEDSFSKGSKLPLDPLHSFQAFRSLASQRERKATSARSADGAVFLSVSGARKEKRKKNLGVQGELAPLGKAPVIIVGIGNSFRGDDGAGWAVIDELAGKVPSSVTLLKQRGDIAELLDIFGCYPTVYVVDACVGEGSPGSWRRLDALREEIPLEQVHTSTHGFSISQAIAMGEELQQLPSILILYALYGNNFRMDTCLSPRVAQAIPHVVRALLQEKEVRVCMKKE